MLMPTLNRLNKTHLSIHLDVPPKSYLITFLSAGSLLDAMADAVEQASVVIICLTEKYKESANCRMGILQYLRVFCLAERLFKFQ